MLSARGHMTIRLATAPYKFPAARENDVLEQLGWSATIFWRHVNGLLDRPEELAAYPVVHRLRRLRDQRRQRRTS